MREEEIELMIKSAKQAAKNAAEESAEIVKRVWGIVKETTDKAADELKTTYGIFYKNLTPRKRHMIFWGNSCKKGDKKIRNREIKKAINLRGRKVAVKCKK